MTLSRDLFLAILSMDSYNQGHGKGVDHGASKIGTATFKQDDNSNEAQAAGFYAVAYDTQYGTVISYRGTDNPSIFADEVTGAGDITAGWVTGGGVWQTDQVRFSQEFFQAATGTVGENANVADAILTGHSLGGGLAGVIASLHGQEALVFDNMPFELASDSAQDAANSDTLFGIAVRGYAQDTFYNGGEPWEIDRSKISAKSLNFEILQDLRDLGGQETAVEAYESHSDASRLNFVDRALKLHMMDYLVQFMFAAENSHDDWQSLGREFYEAYFSDEIATSAGSKNLNGAAGEAAKMGRAIAYSALDEGNLIFGDTGIRAMFDDLDELGYVYNSTFDPGRDGLLAANDNQGNRGAIGRAA